MKQNEIIFSFINWKSPHIIFPFSSFILIGCLFIWDGILGNNYGIILSGSTLVLITLLLIWLVSSPKITITGDGIAYSSLFKSRFINWKEVKSIGGYTRTRYSNIPVDLADLGQFSIWGQRFLFISILEIDQVKWNQKINDEIIYFHFRSELLKEIINYLKENSNPLPLRLEKKSSVGFYN